MSEQQCGTNRKKLEADQSENQSFCKAIKLQQSLVPSGEQCASVTAVVVQYRQQLQQQDGNVQPREPLLVPRLHQNNDQILQPGHPSSVSLFQELGHDESRHWRDYVCQAGE